MDEKTPTEKEEARQRLVAFSDLSQYQEDLFTVLRAGLDARDATHRVSLLEKEVATLVDKNSVLEYKINSANQENSRLMAKIEEMKTLLSLVRAWPEESTTKEAMDKKLTTDITANLLDFNQALLELNHDYPGLRETKGKRRKSLK